MAKILPGNCVARRLGALKHCESRFHHVGDAPCRKAAILDVSERRPSRD